MGNMQETLSYLSLARFGYQLGYKLTKYNFKLLG
jgi:hypothetical protein